ncbi:MAG: thioredoxin-dependent thiol peroxidase [Bacteroidetes bacterium]|nr:thioredoxin-dependent thiol peroxidase [Bacteroidota bacterium]
MLELGDKAPDFVGPLGDGGQLRLSDFSGRKIALYFYPMNNTPGCVLEACSIRDNWDPFEKAGIVVIGVSPNSVRSHWNFAAKHDLPFFLVADRDKKVIDLYGVWGEKKMFGRSFLGLKRTTFLIDESGKIVKIFKRPKNRIHGKEILDAFAELQ